MIHIKPNVVTLFMNQFLTNIFFSFFEFTEEKKAESESEEDDDMGFGLFE